MKPTPRLLAIAALAALVTVPLAGLAAGGEMRMYEQLDLNEDGRIDPDEASRSAQATADFRQIDTDGDGALTREEWQAYFSATGSAQSGGSASSPGAPTTNRRPDSAAPGGY